MTKERFLKWVKQFYDQNNKIPNAGQAWNWIEQNLLSPRATLSAEENKRVWIEALDFIEAFADGAGYIDKEGAIKGLLNNWQISPVRGADNFPSSGMVNEKIREKKEGGKG